VALAIKLGTAALTQAVGLSLALGAFLGGLLVSGSDYAHETLARLLSVRDAFVALFFVTVGALMNPAAVVDHLPLVAAIVGLVMVGKLIIWSSVVALLGQPFWTAVLLGIGLTQIGEFSFILIQVARTAGHVTSDVYNATLAASLLTILGNAFLMRYAWGWMSRAGATWERDTAAAPAGANALAGHVVVCGFVLHPRVETILRPGDSVRVVGLRAQVEAFQQGARGGARGAR
jgi:CPA2 family monovalent cation:H+ antiporter-2